MSFVLDDAQATWDRLCRRGVPYRHAKLVLFRDVTETACGEAQTATGPFYCPGDQKVYIDLGFFDELQSKFGAPGDFAQAYVIAHEIGHHVQQILGTERPGALRAERSEPSAANHLFGRLEAQADCFAGVWGRRRKQRDKLDTGDIEEGYRAAAAVGDDRSRAWQAGRVSR